MKKNLMLILLLAGGWGSNISAMEQKIQVKTVEGKTIYIPITGNITLADIKEAIKKETGIVPEFQRLQYKGKMLEYTLEGDAPFNPIFDPEDPVAYLIKRPPPRPATPPAQPAEYPRKIAEPPSFTRTQKVGIALTTAALVAAVAGFMKIRAYKKTKRRLIKKYRLASLTTLQNKTWLATVLASHGVSWYLRRLVQNNEGSLTDFVGTDPRTIAELYYGHAPTANELNAFLAKFFAGKR